MNKGREKKTGVVKWSIFTVICAILLIASIIGTNFALAASQAINIYLKTDTYKIVDHGDGDEDTEYFKSEFDSEEELKAHDKEVAE